MRLSFAVWCSLQIKINLFRVPTANKAFAQLLDPGALCYSAPANVHACHMYGPLNPLQHSDALLIMFLGMPLDTPHEP